MWLFRVEKLNDFRILWIKWFCLIYCFNVDDDKKIGIWKSEYGRLFFVFRKGIGYGRMADYYRQSLYGR